MMKPTLYVVEDDVDLQHLLALRLSKSGYNVEVFSTGYPIVEMTEYWPDLFILDIEVPGINGLELCRWLKSNEESKYIPVIFLSAAPYLKTLAENVKGDDYLEKPFDFKLLVQKINNCLTSDPIAVR